jgi:hypothetical protein
MEKYIAKFTEIMREADKAFETTGGGTRHYVRDVLFPIMEREGLLLTDQQTGARWVTGQYDRLYTQLKAEPDRKIVCWVDYQWGLRDEPKEILRDICAIMGRVMGFNARGIGYGGAEIWIGEENEKKEFLEECERLHVQWLDECAGEKDNWISVEDQLPTESGRYWCYIQELTDLGFSYFQWNCAYNANERRFSDSNLTNGENVTHWRNLPDPPKRKEVSHG